MNRRRFLQTALSTSLGSFLFQDSSMLGTNVEARNGGEDPAGFETIGLYASLPTDPPPMDPQVYRFFQACGYNYLEFCEAGYRSRPDLLPHTTKTC